SAANSGYQAERVTIRLIPVSEPFQPVCGGGWLRWGPVSDEKKLLIDGFTTKIACPTGSFRVLVYPSGVDVSNSGSAGSASDGKSATTPTKPSTASPAPSSAGDASTTSQTVRNA